MKIKMKTKTNHALAVAVVLGALVPAAGAAPALHSAHKSARKPKAAMYRAQCGMTYTAAEAKKDGYICPMDHKKMMRVQ